MVVLAEPAIAAELLRLATTAVAEATGLAGGSLSIGAAADFMLLDNGPRRQNIQDGTALEPLVLSSTNFWSGRVSNRTKPPQRVVFRGGRKLLFVQERYADPKL